MEEEKHSRWSDLPTDIVCSILRSIPRLDDRIRFAAVCKHWRSSSILQLSSQPSSSRSSAWLVLSSSHKEKKPSSFNLSDGNFYNLRIPDFQDARICGSFENWLAVARPNGDNFLLDPFSRVKIPLPASIDKTHFFKKVILSSSPTSEGPVFVVALFPLDHPLLVKLGPSGTSWTRLPKARYSSDMVFYKGLLHCILSHKKLCAFEMDNIGQVISTKCLEIQPVKCLEIQPVVSQYHCRKTYLVESGQRLLMVRRSFANHPKKKNFHITTGFKVFELQFELQWIPPCRWIEVESLDGHAVFLGTTCAKSVLASRCAGVEEDCIYFTDDHRYFDGRWPSKRKWYPRFDSGVFSMTDWTITKPFEAASGSPFVNFGSSKSPPLWFHFNMQA